MQNAWSQYVVAGFVVTHRPPASSPRSYYPAGSQCAEDWICSPAREAPRSKCRFTIYLPRRAF